MTRRSKASKPDMTAMLAHQELMAAVQLLQAGRLNDARAAYHQLLTANPQNAIALHHLAIIEHQLGNSDDAIGLLQKSLSLNPRSAQALSDQAVVLMHLRRDSEAIEVCRKAISLDPHFAAAHSNLGDLLLRHGDQKAAEKAYGKAVCLQPNLAAAQIGRGEALIALGRLEEARFACDASIRLAPDAAEAHGLCGLLLSRTGEQADAERAYRRALELNPHLALVHTRLGNLLRSEGRLEDALAANERALQADPACVEAHCNRALTLQALGRYEEALSGYSDALAVRPDFPEALANLGLLLHHLGQSRGAIAVLKRALALAPEKDFPYVYLGSILKDQGELTEALEVYCKMMKACGTPPPEGLYDYCNLRRQICGWKGLDEEERRAVDAIIASGERMPPFSALAMACGPADHLALARSWASGFKLQNLAKDSQPRMAATGKKRIRLGYLSSDFFQHATASLIAELIERHDRERFEIFAYCHSPDDRSPMRTRLTASFDKFHLIGDISHPEAAGLVARDGIDILIDLKGYTRNARSMILAMRPAPIQVNYLGYPSTMGAPFMDYIIADPVVAPFEHQLYFDEKIVHLQHCYQPNDRQRETLGAPSRADCGLPDGAFVFCCFNNAYKITEPIFAIWMRLLHQIPESVLWLLDANELAKGNICREAVAFGLDPARVVFAPKIPSAQHLARYALADLFLDNLPVNAHTTASEALWSGLPVVTCLGEVFVGRVAASLLRACGLPELIAETLTDYEALALRFASDRGALDSVRQKLVSAQKTAPLFDTDRYARDIEVAFIHMVERRESGLPPESFRTLDVRPGRDMC